MKSNSTLLSILFLYSLACYTSLAPAQVPHVVQFRSGISLNGTNYDGIGFFKFALVSPEGSKTFWSNDGSSVSASEPFKALPIDVDQGAYEVLLGDTSLTNMLPVSPTVFTNTNVQVRVWFSQNGQVFMPVVPDQPIASVAYAMMAATVPDASITSSKLAEGAVTAGKLAPQAVTGANIAAGSIGSTQLAPNAAANNLQASGGLLLSDQPNATNLLNAGFRRIGVVNSEKEQWEVFTPYGPAPRAGHMAVWTGSEMYVWGGLGRPEPLVALGERYNPVTDTWNPVQTNKSLISFLQSPRGQAIWTGSEMLIVFNQVGQPGYIYTPETDTLRPISRTNAPFPSINGTYVVWTGKELLVWGGNANSYRYNLKSNAWTKISSVNAPRTSTLYPSVVWTGSEMIVWGGSSTSAKSGGRYDPATDTWKSIKASTNSTARTQHNAVWTGRYMIVWGGRVVSSLNSSSTGEMYDPATDSWKAISVSNAPLGRVNFNAFWTGTEMLVWGGYSLTNNRATVLMDGGRYNPATDTWTPLPQAPLQPLIGCSAVWTGSEMMVWGGTLPDPRRITYVEAPYIDQNKPFSNAGWRYHPVSNTWKPMAFTPSGRIGHSAVWTGDELIVWGGGTSYPSSLRGLLLDGARFNPVVGRWYPISSFNAPTIRTNHQAIWTGVEMVVWGGEGVRSNLSTEYSLSILNTGGRYNPVTDTWRSIDTNGAPSPRTSFSMVWAQDEMIVFGGRTNVGTFYSMSLNNGGRYNPFNDSWSSLSSLAAPGSRNSHSAVWADHEMLVWGGTTNMNYPSSVVSALSTGARYNLTSNRWSPMSTNGSPTPRRNHIAVWTGDEMIIWDGEGVNARNGGRYNPVSNTWEPVSTVNAPLSTRGQKGVWTGSELIVWGGQSPTRYAGRYNPETDTWTPISSSKAPRARVGFQAVWADDEMLVFGGGESPGASAGASTGSLPNSLLRYRLTSPIYLYGK